MDLTLNQQLDIKRQEIIALKHSAERQEQKFYKIMELLSQARKEYKKLDRKLAMIDGRYKVLDSSDKGEKKTNIDLSRLSKEQITNIINAVNEMESSNDS